MHQSSRTIVLLSTLSLAVLPAVQAPTTAAAATATDTGEANVVVVARFKADTIGDGETGLNAKHPVRPDLSRWFQLKSEYADQHEPYFASTLTLDAYIRHASANQRKVSSFFPQDAPGTSGPSAHVTYIDLPCTRAEYETKQPAPDTQLLKDVATALDELNTPDSKQWDTNEDGKIDNLSVLVQVPTTEPISASSPLLWPHHARLNSEATVDDLSIDHYNLIPARHTTADSPDYTLGLNPSTIKQAYLSTLGLQPLYRNEASREQNSGPVGLWDPMAKAANQYPLAQSREDLGWTTINSLPTTPGTQTITLHAPGSTAGPAAVRIAPGQANGESFILEYRQKGEYQPGPAPMDRQIPRSGLLVYRVNPAVAEHSNITSPDGSHRDYLYVFRPGATSQHSADGHLNEAALTAPTGRFAVGGSYHGIRSRLGSAAPSATLDDGAIVDSQGRNTGLLVQVTEQSADSITFTLEVPDSTTHRPWKTAPIPQAAELRVDALTQPASATSPKGVAAVTVRRPDGSLAVATQSDGTWASLGGPELEAGKQWGSPALAWLGEQLYLLVPDNTEGATRVVLWTHDGSQWTQVAEHPSLSSTSHPVLQTLGSTLHALVGSDGENSQVLRLNPSSALEPVGPALPGHLVSPALTLTGAAPTVVAGHLDDNSSQVLRLEGTSWTVTSSKPGLTRAHAAATWGEGVQERSLLVRSAAPGVAQLTLLDATGKVLQDLPAKGLSGSTSLLQLVVSDGVAYLMTASGASNTVEVHTSALQDLRSWGRLGEAVASSNSQATMTVSAKQVLVLAKNRQATDSAVYTFPAVDPASLPTTPPSTPASQASTVTPAAAQTGSATPTAAPSPSATTSPAPSASASPSAHATTPTPQPSPAAQAVPTPRPAPTTAAPSTQVPAPTPQSAPTPYLPPQPSPANDDEATAEPTASLQLAPPVRPPLLPPEPRPGHRATASASATASATPSGPASTHPSSASAASSGATPTAVPSSSPQPAGGSIASPTASPTATAQATDAAAASPQTSASAPATASAQSPESLLPADPQDGGGENPGEGTDGDTNGDAGGTTEGPADQTTGGTGAETGGGTRSEDEEAPAPEVQGAATSPGSSLPAGAEPLPLRRSAAAGTKAHSRLGADTELSAAQARAHTGPAQSRSVQARSASATSLAQSLRPGTLAALSTKAAKALCSCSGPELASLLTGGAALGASGAFLLVLRRRRG
ncbi:M6 family metalloprotease domain [Actinomyces bovis]|uniref:M6 family metalloprotease domain n=1 Tax=Actinomyces bovis TaxID=1658 RepID=A0ABY1VNV9_9ACTO|nr:hypothetical protein [Actinomyces bovis]SPT52753.1 M6 family metalloprotease domain [Actinomyces bovis]VEG54751.1 M6 family metalloprotease domain [Actinomyces israelii]